MTATQRPRPGRTWAATALRRAIGALRFANDELLRANEAMFRPAGAPRDSGPGAATRATPPATAGAPGAARPPAPAKASGGGAGRAA
jgi:hypothetical protein